MTETGFAIFRNYSINYRIYPEMLKNHDFDFHGNQNHFFGNQNQNHFNFGNQNQNQNHPDLRPWKSIKIKIIFGNQNQNHNHLYFGA